MADVVSAVIADARSKLGARYVWGAEGPNTFDCSGLMQWAYGRHGVKLPRVAAEQAKVGQAVKLGQERPGDLIFSTWDDSPDVDHVALYVGDGQYIHAPKPGDVVKVGTLTDTYRKHVTGIRRVAGGGVATDPVSFPTGSALDPTGLVGAVQNVAGGLRDMAGGVGHVGELAKKAAWLALPTSMVRLAAGGAGVAFLLVGVWFLAREVRA